VGFSTSALQRNRSRGTSTTCWRMTNHGAAKDLCCSYSLRSSWHSGWVICASGKQASRDSKRPPNLHPHRLRLTLPRPHPARPTIQQQHLRRHLPAVRIRLLPHLRRPMRLLHLLRLQLLRRQPRPHRLHRRKVVHRRALQPQRHRPLQRRPLILEGRPRLLARVQALHPLPHKRTCRSRYLLRRNQPNRKRQLRPQ
jgi:hypothetical protein